MMVKILHFADAHIDMANYGRHDPETGLPMRVIDFLKSLDEIVDTAIQEKVDVVIFAGDAYKDRNPAPTFQREWEKRIMRLSRAGIPVLLLVGNHDLSPALGRAHALDEFTTLEVPQVRVLDKPEFMGPDDLWGLPLQVIALPWVSRSGMIAHLDMSSVDTEQIYEQLGDRLSELVVHWIESADKTFPIVLTAHASVQGASYGGERTVMLGRDVVLSGSLVKNPQLDYVALGHIHKPQNLTRDIKETQEDPPPVVYPGSIERIDFGEVGDDKFFVIARVERGHTEVQWHQLKSIRPFIDRYLQLNTPQGITGKLLASLPPQEEIAGAIIRLVVDYPREWESMVDEAALREYTSSAFEFHLVKRPQMEARVRLPEGQMAGRMTPIELLDIYWNVNHIDQDDAAQLNSLASEIIQGLEEEV
jgi:exonuclease SbcD